MRDPILSNEGNIENKKFNRIKTINPRWSSRQDTGRFYRGSKKPRERRKDPTFLQGPSSTWNTQVGLLVSKEVLWDQEK